MFSWSILAFVLVLLLARPISGVGSLGVDLAIILHDGAQFTNARNKALNLSLSQDLPQVFEIGEDKTRVALVANVNGTDTPQRNGFWDVFVNLTGNASEFVKAVYQVSPIYLDRNLFGGLKLVREKVFVGEAKRPGVVLLISHADQVGVSSAAQDEGELLREAGVPIYTIYEPGNRDQDNRHVRLVGGDENSIFRVYNLTVGVNQETFRNVMKVMSERLCTYEQKCFFVDAQLTCEKAYYTPTITIALSQGGDCSSVGIDPPASKKESCDADECQEVCNDLWPLEDACPDDDTCGGGKKIGRQGDYQWKQLEFCPSQYECPPCTTPSPDPEPSGTNVGLILGIVIPIVLFILIAAAAVAGVWFVKRNKDEEKPKKGRKGVSKKKGASGKKKGVSGKKKRRSDVEAGSEVESAKESEATTVNESELEKKKAKTKSKSGKKLSEETKDASSKSDQTTGKAPSESEVETTRPKPIPKSKSKSKSKVQSKAQASKTKKKTRK